MTLDGAGLWLLYLLLAIVGAVGAFLILAGLGALFVRWAFGSAKEMQP